VSTQALGGAPAGVTAGELAAAQRVQQLQALIASARIVAAGGSLPARTTAGAPETQAPGNGFASALQAATSAASGVVGSPGIGTASGVAYAPAGLGQPALQSASAAGGSGEYESLIAQAAARNGVDPAVLHGLIQQESGFDPNATSSAGASGLTQLMPGTASSLGVADPLNPAESIEGGARYLSQMMSRFGGNTADALAAYNAGPGAVEQYRGIPPYAETQSYVTKVLGYAEAYRQSHPATATGELL
jgi:soluble lytic murein transglycosylase-like protein